MTSPTPPKLLKLTPLHSKANPSFFEYLESYLLHTQRLKRDPIDIYARYHTASLQQSGSGGVDMRTEETLGDEAPMNRRDNKRHQLPSFVNLDEESFLRQRLESQQQEQQQQDQQLLEASQSQLHQNHIEKFTPFASLQNLCMGTLYPTHTETEFLRESKTRLLANHANNTFTNAIKDASWLKNPSGALVSFLVHAFMDLKSHQCYYWFAFPGVKLKENVHFTEAPHTRQDAFWNQSSFASQYKSFRENHSPQERSFFLIRSVTDSEDASQSQTIFPLSEWKEAFVGSQEQDGSSPKKITTILACNDASFRSDRPAWYIRNYLVAAAVTFRRSQFKMLCIREIPHPTTPDLSSSLYFEASVPSLLLEIPLNKIDTAFSFVGWEKNSKNKYGPRVTQLHKESPEESAATLNVQLMKWRMAPELKDQLLSNTKCLLLGAGTLGCYVARNLLGWGIFNITFVDRGHVSYSNPVRQPLYEFADCQNGGKYKVDAAVESLKRVYPKVNARGVVLSIPMPGHVYDPSEKSKIEKNVDTLEDLIKEHDVVFLLTDSREARWLPTLLGLVHDKIVINSALGFDSYVVMRHGVLSDAEQKQLKQMKSSDHGCDSDGASSSTTEEIVPERLGCYYCSSVVAPADSTTDRTLDQQCTVTRPGVAGIASAVATELLINLLHHPKRHHAPCTSSMDEDVPNHSPLGIIPHQIRGSLYGFDTVRMRGRNYSQCIACSPKIIEQYVTRRMDFLHEAFLKPTSLEKLTGLDKLAEDAEERLRRLTEESKEDGDDEGDDDEFELIL